MLDLKGDYSAFTQPAPTADEPSAPSDSREPTALSRDGDSVRRDGVLAHHRVAGRARGPTRVAAAGPMPYGVVFIYISKQQILND